MFTELKKLADRLELKCSYDVYNLLDDYDNHFEEYNEVWSFQLDEYVLTIEEPYFSLYIFKLHSTDYGLLCTAKVEETIINNDPTINTILKGKKLGRTLLYLLEIKTELAYTGNGYASAMLEFLAIIFADKAIFGESVPYGMKAYTKDRLNKFYAKRGFELISDPNKKGYTYIYKENKTTK